MSLAMTIGIVVVVFADAGPATSSVGDGEGGAYGILYMAAAMFCRSLGNVVQQRAYLDHGKHVEEVMFVTHVLGLPIFLWSAGAEIPGQLVRWASEDAQILYALLLAVVVLNYAITRACACVVGLSNPVVLNLVLTVQRFLSIALSAALINELPPPELWVGAALVLGGCVAFFLSGTPKRRRASQGRKGEKMD